MLPDNIGFGRVRMRALLGVPDSPNDDDEFPEARGATGTVKFVPAVTRVVNVTGPEALTIGLPTIEGTFDTEGRLCGPDGVPGVYLIATDDTDNQPVNWTYRVQFAITGIAVPDIDIHVPEGSDTDLTLVVPVPSSPGVGQNQWENLVLRAEAAASRADDAVYTLVVNGTTYTPDENGVVTLTVAAGATSWDDLTDKPTTFPPSTHTHPIIQVTGLQTALDGKRANTARGMFPVEYTGTAWEFTSLAQAQAAGLQPSDNLIFLGETDPPGWADEHGRTVLWSMGD